MTPIYFNSLSNDEYNEDEFLSPNSQASSSSNSLTCHLFFNPTTTHDQDETFNGELHSSQNEDDNSGSQAYDDHYAENQEDRLMRRNGGLKFSLWKSETYNDDDDDEKWTSSTIRVMVKTKKTNLQSSATQVIMVEDDKEPTANSNSINNTCSNYNNIPIRVCSDCNTTKTPLWRSGPQGPKSLCNACGIRQRKARKALAMAAAETNKYVFNDKLPITSLKATKIVHKKTNSTGHIAKYKKKHEYSKHTNAYPARTNCVEDFLINIRKNLAFHCVFPQDDKEAAILLMALSCG